MPGKQGKHTQRKGENNVPSPSINRTGRATDKAQETKQRSQSIIQKLRNSDNRNNSEPLEEDAEVEEYAEDQVGSPKDLSSVFDMATPTKRDQQEEGEGSDTSESDARASPPSPTHTDPEHPLPPTRGTPKGQQQGQQEQAQGQHQEQRETSQDKGGDAHPPSISTTPPLAPPTLQEEEARTRIISKRDYEYGAKGFLTASTTLIKWLKPSEDKTNKEEQAPNPAPIIKDRDWPATVAVNKNSLLLPSKSPLYEYIEGPQMTGGPPLSGQTYRYGLAKCNSTNQYARLLPKSALEVLHQEALLHLGGGDLLNTFRVQGDSGFCPPSISKPHTMMTKLLKDNPIFFLQVLPFDAPPNMYPESATLHEWSLNLNRAMEDLRVKHGVFAQGWYWSRYWGSERLWYRQHK